MPYATNKYVYTAQGLANTVDALNHTNWFVRDVAGRLLYRTNANNEVFRPYISSIYIDDPQEQYISR
jgi:hypothetical protein